MKKKEEVYFVYRLNEVRKPSEEAHDQYCIVYLFDESSEFSLCSKEEARATKESIVRDFETKKHLWDFATEFIHEHSYEKAYLLSVSDYNIGLEASKSDEDIQNLFSQYGHCLENTNEGKSKSFLSKIF